MNSPSLKKGVATYALAIHLTFFLVIFVFPVSDCYFIRTELYGAEEIVLTATPQPCDISMQAGVALRRLLAQGERNMETQGTCHKREPIAKTLPTVGVLYHELKNASLDHLSACIPRHKPIHPIKTETSWLSHEVIDSSSATGVMPHEC